MHVSLWVIFFFFEDHGKWLSERPHYGTKIIRNRP